MQRSYTDVTLVLRVHASPSTLTIYKVELSSRQNISRGCISIHLTSGSEVRLYLISTNIIPQVLKYKVTY